MTLVTQAEFARSHGVSRKTATKWKEAGRLVFVGEKVDSEASDALLRDARLGRFKDNGKVTPDTVPRAKGNTEDADTNVPGVPDSSPILIDAVADTGTIQAFLNKLLNGQYSSQSEAERVKENALAGVRALELQVKAGSLVEMETAEMALFEGARSVRDAWLNWPSRVGPMMAADLGLPPDKVVEVLTKYVHEQLADLGEPQAEFRKQT